MKVNCLHCGHAFGVDDSYCDYEGLLKCPTCGGLLDARIQDGMIRSVRPGSLTPQPVQQEAAPAPAPAPAPVVQQPQAQPQAQPAPAAQTPSAMPFQQATETPAPASPPPSTSLSGNTDAARREAA